MSPQKTDFTITPSVKHKIKTGFAYTHHTLYPSGFSGSIPGSGNRVTINKDSINKLYSAEMALYAGDEFDAKNFSVNYGLRAPFLPPPA